MKNSLGGNPSLQRRKDLLRVSTGGLGLIGRAQYKAGAAAHLVPTIGTSRGCPVITTRAHFMRPHD